MNCGVGCQHQNVGVSINRFIHCGFYCGLHGNDDGVLVFFSEIGCSRRSSCIAGDDYGFCSMRKQKANAVVAHFPYPFFTFIAIGCIDAVPVKYKIFIWHVVPEDTKHGDAANP